MPNSWQLTRTVGAGGRFLVMMTPPLGTPRDVTFVRGAPVKITYSSSDPFGDSVATLTFNQVTAFDERASYETHPMLADDAAVDIWWIPAMSVPAAWPAGMVGSNADTMLWQNPLTGLADQVAPQWTYQSPYGSAPNFTYKHTSKRRGTKVWEGFVTSQEVSSSSDGDVTTLQCQGALFQADCYLAKPFFPPRPWPLERLIARVFDRSKYPHLRTNRFRIDWPDDWSLTAPPYNKDLDNSFWPNISPGSKWTGYTTRQTGSWDHSLTAYISQMLAVMLVKPGSGSTPGNQWTLRLAHEGDPDYPAGRTPVLTVRDRYKAADFLIWAGLPGVDVSLTRDATQRADAIYGSGTDFAGSTWNNSIIDTHGARTDYKPLAASHMVYPVLRNQRLVKARIARESYVQYGTGFSEVAGIESAEQTLSRELDAGWSGTVTLAVDPSTTLSRWCLQAGMMMRLQGFRGTGGDGLKLHIAEVQADVESGTVSLTVDTRFRDLLTLSEAIARTRDALTPAKLLSLNKNSVTIEDLQMPWSYAKGSGFIPKHRHLFDKHKPVTEQFPYPNWAKLHPPKLKPHWYVRCDANNTKKHGHLGRWSGPHWVRMGEKGTIRRTEVAVYGLGGNLLAIPFHFSLYYAWNNDATFMPHNEKGNYDPLAIPGAFEEIDPKTGQVWVPAGGHMTGVKQIFCIGWGNREQPAGYSPGMKTQGGHPTGMLVDETPWTYDFTSNNPNYDKLAKAGKLTVRQVTLFAWFYCDYTDPVYFAGRLYRQSPGTT